MQGVHHARKIRRRLRELPALLAKAKEGGGDYDGTLYHERVFDNLSRPDAKPAFHIWKALGGEWYAAWTEREDGAILINRLWMDHDGYCRDAEEARAQSSRGLFDDPAAVQWSLLEDEIPEQSNEADSRASEAAGADPGAAANLELLEWKRKMREANRSSADALQRNAELRKRVTA